MITVYHIPICPFCQRLEILLELKGVREKVRFEVVDVTKPRAPELLAKTDGTTALPILETADGEVLKESLVLMEFLDTKLPSPVARADSLERAIEQMLIAMGSGFIDTGYRFVMNQDESRREAIHEKMLKHYADIDRFLCKYNADGVWLFESFGYAEAAYAPFFQRFWFLEYYEGFEIPDEPRFERVRRWIDACVDHAAAQQTSKEEIVKLYYDYALGRGNGALVDGRERSSFVLEPSWRERPWPPRAKYDGTASDEELGLL